MCTVNIREHRGQINGGQGCQMSHRWQKGTQLAEDAAKVAKQPLSRPAAGSECHGPATRRTRRLREDRANHSRHRAFTSKPRIWCVRWSVAPSGRSEA
eukprot:gene11809-biopygen4473